MGVLAWRVAPKISVVYGAAKPVPALIADELPDEGANIVMEPNKGSPETELASVTVLWPVAVIAAVQLAIVALSVLAVYPTNPLVVLGKCSTL